MPAHPLTQPQITRIRQMRADGHTQAATAAVVGCHPWTVRKYAPGLPGKVPNDRLRTAFLASGRTPADVARSLGWRATNGTPSGTRVRQTLGLVADAPGRFRSLIDWETGSLIAEAIGVAPWEVLDDDLEAAA